MNIKRTIKAALFCLLAAGTAHADEGMWVLKELNKQNLARMQELGFTPTYEQLYSETDPCVANAVVIFGGGCTGITVSEEGLIFTSTSTLTLSFRRARRKSCLSQAWPSAIWIKRLM